MLALLKVGRTVVATVVAMICGAELAQAPEHGVPVEGGLVKIGAVQRAVQAVGTFKSKKVSFSSRKCLASSPWSQGVKGKWSPRVRSWSGWMTAGAMILGAMPLAFAEGAGHEGRHAIGWVIVSGMSFGTVLTVFVVPAF